IQFFSHRYPPTTMTYTLTLHDALPIYNRNDPEKRVLTQRQSNGGHHPQPVRAMAAALLMLLLFLPGADGSSSASAQPQSRLAYKDRKSTRLNSSHVKISYAVFCLKKKK